MVAFKKRTVLSVALLGGVAAGALVLHRHRAPVAKQEVASETAEAAAPRLARQPLRFERNEGQLDPTLAFIARGKGYGLYFTKEGPTLALQRDENAHRPTRRGPTFRSDERRANETVFSMRIAGGREVEPVGGDTLPGTSNYLVGADRARWKSQVRAYGKVTYPQVLPGVDLVCYGADQGRMEYDLVLAPGVDPAGVAFRFGGVRSVSLEGAEAVVRLPDGATVRQPAPMAYELDDAGEKTAVAAAFAMRGDGALGFSVPGHDRRRRLVIDPVLVYATYLGGSANDELNGIATDAAGNVYVAGYTASASFPTRSPLQGASAGGKDVVVAKLSATGALLASTYFGGSGNDVADGIAVDAAGNIYIAGVTNSTNLPTASPAQATNGGDYDAFVAKLGSSGASLLYATYFGGAGYDEGFAIAVDGSGRAHVAGYTESTDLPTIAPRQAAYAGGGDGFVAKLAAAGSSFAYATYLGGNDLDFPSGIALDAAGNAYVAGGTSSTDFPTTAALQPFNAGGYSDAFVTKLNAAGSALVYSTMLGTAVYDWATGIAVDASGNAYVSGYTDATNFPTTVGAAQTAAGGDIDGFVAKLNATATGLVYATYLGGAGVEYANAVGLDATGAAVVVGYTESTNFPTVTPPAQASQAGLGDLFITKLAPTGASRAYSTYFGGGASDTANAVAVSGAGDILVAGSTDSTNFPVLNGAFSSKAGATDAVVLRLRADAPPPPPVVPAADWRLAFPALSIAAVLALGAQRKSRRRATRG